MSKRHGRPWERTKGIDRFSTTRKPIEKSEDAGKNNDAAPPDRAASSSTSKAPDQQPSENDARGHNPSFMIVDGNTYYADRFYLMKPEDGAASTNSANFKSGQRPEAQASSNNGCTCGSQEAPPTLDRKRLIQSLSLKAAIVATFTVSPSYLTELFDNVPTLVLHGHKGLHNRMQRTAKGGTVIVKKKEDDDDTSPLKKQKLSDVSNQYPTTSSAPIQIIKKEEEEAPPEEAWFAAEESEESVELPETMHLTQVLSAWLPPSRVSTLSRKSPTSSSSSKQTDDGKNGVIELLDDSDDDEPLPTVSFSGIDAHTVRQRRSKRGVHHPKFMLLFETSGSLVVVVSTSNLTTPKGSVDGIWVQRFVPVATTTIRPKMKMPERRVDGSDFGHVLADFLHKQSNAARVGQMLPLEFMQHYTNASSDATLESCLADAYQFEASQVHLIATVPGEYMGRNAVTHWGKRNASTGQRPFLYGPQRVHDVMVRLAEQQTALRSNEDRLICQPTSLGGHWTTSDMTALAKCYMAGDGKVMDRMDIMWPTTEFIKRIQKSKKTARPEAPEDEGDAGDGAGFLFLSSLSFNTIDIDCISRMAQYEHSSPRQLSSLRCPHFKSYARLFEGNEYELRQRHDVGKAAEIFTWFLMTSACLSRGAQGFPTADRMEGSDQVSYANFELGILFCSKLQKESGDPSERVYCFKPNQCACKRNQHRINKKLIHLPIPYAMRGQPYQAEEEEAHMYKTPYFHEITPETACVGLMALTPFGKARAAKQSSRTLASSQSYAKSSSW